MPSLSAHIITTDPPKVMENSANYHKFRPFEDEDEIKAAKTRRQKSTVLVALVIVAATAILVVAVIATTGLVLGIQSNQEAQASGLSNVQNTPGELRGRYNGEPGAGGIIFHSTVNDSFVFLSITTHNGTLVVKLLHSISTSMTVFDTDNNNFLVLESKADNKRTFAEYLIPKNSTKLIQSMMSKGENMTDDVLQHMDNKTVSKVRQFSLEKLAMSKVAILIIEAAETLGFNTTFADKAGPAARVFYMLALQLQKARASKGETNHDVTKRSRQQRQREQCSSYDTVCPANRCPHSEQCFGMCGYGCRCWSWVCGDCCVHELCLTHDQCCRNHGFYTLTCFSVVWYYPTLACTDQYTC